MSLLPWLLHLCKKGFYRWALESYHQKMKAYKKVFWMTTLMLFYIRKYIIKGLVEGLWKATTKRQKLMRKCFGWLPRMVLTCIWIGKVLNKKSSKDTFISHCDMHAMQVSFIHYIVSLATFLSATSPIWDFDRVRLSFCSFIFDYHWNITNLVCICKQLAILMVAVLGLTQLLFHNLREAWQDWALMPPTRGLLIISMSHNN